MFTDRGREVSRQPSKFIITRLGVRPLPGQSQQRYIMPSLQSGSRRIAIKVINHLGDEVMKVFSVR